MDEFNNSRPCVLARTQELPSSSVRTHSVKPKLKPNSKTLSKAISKLKGTSKICDSKQSYRTGHWTDEEHLRFLFARSLYRNNVGAIAKILKTRTEVQIRSHNQKIEAVSINPMNRKLQESVSELLGEKLKKARESLQPENPPALASSVAIDENLLSDFTRILGRKINKNHVITKEDIEYLGLTLLKSEYDSILSYKARATKSSSIQLPTLLKLEDETFSKMDGEQSGRSAAGEKAAGPTLEGGEGSVIATQRVPFSVFSDALVHY